MMVRLRTTASASVPPTRRRPSEGVYTLESSTTIAPDAPWAPETLPTQGSALGTKLPGDPIGTRQRFYRLIQE